MAHATSTSQAGLSSTRQPAIPEGGTTLSVDIECVVVGAGVVGLAVAREMARAGHEVLLIEAAEAIGMGISSRNSEVIHAGIYYPPGSLKAVSYTHLTLPTKRIV